MSKTLLIVHHTPSPHCQEMFEAVVAGATDPEIAGWRSSGDPPSPCRRPTCWWLTACYRRS